MSINHTSWPAPAEPTGIQEHGVITTYTHLPHSMGMSGSSNTVTAWPSANLALYCPIEVDRPFLVAKIGWFNGSFVAGNVDVGIYSVAGTLLAGTGATAQSGTGVVQSVDITDYLLMPGNYFIGVLNTSTGRIVYVAAASAGLLQSIGMYQEATSGTLPAIMTPATMAQTVYPLVALISDVRMG